MILSLKSLTKTIIATLMSFSSLGVCAQRFFVDGYHGGVYGHYPMDWYTQFMADQVKEHPLWFIGLEIEPETWDTVMVRTPDAYREFQKVAAGHQVEYTNPSYGQSYLYCIQGESIIRQFQMGMKRVLRHFPTMRMETYACEEPCYTSCLPTLLPQLGFKYMTLKCPDTCWGGYAQNFGGQFVNLIGPDGTGMVAVPRYECEALQTNSVWQTAGWSNNPEYWQTCEEAGIQQPVAMCYQDAGWKNGQWIGYGTDLKGTEYTLWSDYFAAFAGAAEKPDHRFAQDDIAPGLMWGSQVLQRLAQEVRRSENVLVTAEKVLAMHTLTKGVRPNASLMDEAWRQLLLSQHHDCWIVPYNRLNKNGNWAQNVTLWTASANEIAKKEVEKAASMGRSSENSLLLVNTLPYATNKVFTHDGKTYSVEMKAFGYQTLNLNDLTPALHTNTINIKKGICTVENSLYRLQMDLKRGGVLTSFVTKTDGKEFVDKKSEYAFGELRGFFKDDNAFRSSTESPATVTVIEDNSFVKEVKVDGEIAGVRFAKNIRMVEGDPTVEVKLTIDWKDNKPVGDYDFKPERRRKGDNGPTHVPFYDTKYMLSVLFPTNIGESKIVKDAPFDVCESRLEDTFYNRWDSIKHNVVLNWIDQQGEKSRSLAVFTDHTTSYSYGKNHPLALTVQYSGPGLWGRNYTVSGPTTMTYHLMPHTGNWKSAHLQMINDRLNTPTEVTVVPGVDIKDREEYSLLSLEGTGYSLSSFVNQGDDIILRLFNAEGDDSEKEILLPGNVASMAEVDLNGNVLATMDLAQKENGTAAKVKMPRFAVKTYLLKFIL